VAATRKYPWSCVSARCDCIGSQSQPVIARLARQLNVHPEALQNWIRAHRIRCNVERHVAAV
jgi:hypothetical protein